MLKATVIITHGSKKLNRDLKIEATSNVTIGQLASRIAKIYGLNVDVHYTLSIKNFGAENYSTLNPSTQFQASGLQNGCYIKLHELPVDSAEMTAGNAKNADTKFLAPPVFKEFQEAEKITAPNFPTQQDKPKFPFLPMIMPVLMGSVMLAFYRNPIFVVFFALSPVMMLSNYIEQKRTIKRKMQEAIEKFRNGLKTAMNRLEKLKRHEVSELTLHNPSKDTLFHQQRAQKDLFWARTRDSADFLNLRIGSGNIKSIHTFVPPTGEMPAEIEEELWEAKNNAGVLQFAPVIENLQHIGIFGVTSHDETPALHAIMHFLIAQLAVLHSPKDLEISYIGAPTDTFAFDYLKWLPHFVNFSDIVDSVQKDALRRGNSKNLLKGDSKNAEPEHANGKARVIIVNNAPKEMMSDLRLLYEKAADKSLFLLFLTAHPANLPQFVMTYFVDSEKTIYYKKRGEKAHIDVLELVQYDEIYRIARTISALSDALEVQNYATKIPKFVTLPELFPADIMQSPNAIIENWSRNSKIRALLGATQENLRSGAGFTLDFTADGPHMLLGGTTGSGKSELLQSLIFSLAASTSPEKLTFLLIDYKGGAALSDANKLPHSVGLITDLDEHLSTRALISLRAELLRREKILRRYGAKDLQTLQNMLSKTANTTIDANTSENAENAYDNSDIFPSLMIIIDEFATLVKEIPEFIDGILDVAQRGRSLGVHLVLATQYPAGVIKENIRANTNIKMALRTANDTGSLDIVSDKVAHTFDISQPGRAVVRIGSNDLVHFQSAYIGDNSLERAKNPHITISEFTSFGERELQENIGTKAIKTQVNTQEVTKTDADYILAQVKTANKTLKLPAPRKPFLDPLPKTLHRNDIAAPNSATQLILGKTDIPAEQAQLSAILDLNDITSALTIGETRCGKTNALQVLASEALKNTQSAGENAFLYIITANPDEFNAFENLPQTGAIINITDIERLRRLAMFLDSELHANAKNAEVQNGKAQNTEARPQKRKIFVLIDGIDLLHDHMQKQKVQDNTMDIIKMALQRGSRANVHVFASATQASQIPSQIAQSFDKRVNMRQNPDALYMAIGAKNKLLTPESPAGRCIYDGYEMQFVLFDSAELQNINSNNAVSVPKIVNMPAHIKFSDITQPSDNSKLAVGVHFDDFTEFTVDKGVQLFIAGPADSAKSEALQAFGLAAEKQGMQVFDISYDAFTETSLNELQNALQDAKYAENTCITVQNLQDFDDISTESKVADFIKFARKQKVTVAISVNMQELQNSYALISEIKQSTQGIYLMPAQNDAFSVFQQVLPKDNLALAPSRGYSVTKLEVKKIQLAIAENM
ncbi:MAG: hypothetical protein LBL41_03775 [Bifidobacteriaceae bacterium]|jgi:S-DNA-T family DNA segregation ATPase FtsK/SpoIIIE|nr:hypothetical protein [Bifidobacteriaceae bacterium]